MESLATDPLAKAALPALDPELRTALRTLAQEHQGARPRAFLRALGVDYLIVGGLLWGLASIAWTPLFWALLVPGWLLIAARQHALLVLLHDATHGLAHPHRFTNELIGELLCGAPMLVTMSTYRRDHLAHHRSLNSAEDPDWVRKQGTVDERRYWAFPTARGPLSFLAWSWSGSVRYLLRSFTHLSASRGSQQSPTSIEPVPETGTERWVRRLRTGGYLTLALALTWAGGWGLFVLLWLAPILFLLPMLMRIRSIAEHFALPDNTQLNASRNIHCGPLEAFLLAPHNVNLHLDHHLAAAVSFHELPRLHQAFATEPAYVAQAYENDGYFFGRHTLLDNMLGRQGERRRSRHRQRTQIVPPARRRTVSP